MQSRKETSIIGSTEHVDIEGYKNIPAKIDTGADSSSVWASHIDVDKDGVLHFCLFDYDSPFYDGKIYKQKDYKAAVVRNASGQEQIRYRVHLNLTISGRKVKALFNLSDRSNNNFPVLIGRRTISGKFLVDVSKNHTPIPPKNPMSKLIQKHLEEDPYTFHRKYIEELGGNIDDVKRKENK